MKFNINLESTNPEHYQMLLKLLGDALEEIDVGEVIRSKNGGVTSETAKQHYQRKLESERPIEAQLPCGSHSRRTDTLKKKAYLEKSGVCWTCNPELRPVQ